MMYLKKKIMSLTLSKFQPALFPVLLFFLSGNLFSQTNAWINEFHYDNVGADQNEIVEVIIENPGTLSDYTVTLYNGSGGGSYGTSKTLDDFTLDATVGSFSIFTHLFSSIQNGDPDGIALDYQGTVLQFLSYGGTFTATDGPAIGMTSTDIGVSEDSATPKGYSLQLSGNGGIYADFSWEPPAPHTFGAVNNGQSLIGGGNPAPIITNIILTPTTVTSSDAVSISAEITDSDGVASVSLNWGTNSGNLTNTIAMSLGTGDTYTTVSHIPSQPDGTTVYYEISATDAHASPATNTTGELSYTVQDPLPAPSLIISEIADPADDSGARFLEIYNTGNEIVDLDNTQIFLARYANGSSTPQSVRLRGTLMPGDFFVIAKDSTNFQSYYNTTADLESGIINVNGNDTFALFVGDDWDNGGTLFEIYGEIGTDGTGETWEYEDSKVVRNNLNVSPKTIWTAAEWTITSANTIDMTPGKGETSIAYTFNGSWSPTNPNGLVTASDDISILSGTAVFTQDISVNDINVSTGAILEVEDALLVDGDLTNNGTIIFVNNQNKLGQLGEFTGNISGSGSVTTQRYIPAKRAFRFVAATVNSTSSIHDNWQEGATSGTDNPAPGYGTHITGSTTGTNGFDATATGNPSMFGFDNITQAWGTGINNTNTNTLNAGEPWYLLIRGDRSIDLTINTPTPTPTILRATGDLVTGDYTNTNLSQTASGFNFIGNPYQAIVDMNKVLENSTNLNNAYYYLWDPNINEYGSYVLVNLPDGSTVPEGTGNSGANQFLQPGQAAFVSTLSNGPATLLFEEGDKAVEQNPTPVFKTTGATASIAASLYESNSFGNGGNLLDGVLVKFSPTGNNGIDFMDAPKAFNIDENVSLINNAGYFIMENRAMPTTADTIQLYNHNYRHLDYVFQINVTGLDDLTAYLFDTYLGTQTQLTPGINQINFTVDQSIAGSINPTRFSIGFKTLSINEFEQTGFVVYPNPVKNDLFFVSLSGIEEAKVHISLHDLLGRNMLKTESMTNANNRIQISTTHLKPGVYMLNISTQSGKSFTQKIIIDN